MAADYIARGLAATGCSTTCSTPGPPPWRPASTSRPSPQQAATWRRGLSSRDLLSGSYYLQGDSLHLRPRFAGRGQRTAHSLPLEPVIGPLRNRDPAGRDPPGKRAMAGSGRSRPGIRDLGSHEFPPTYEAYQELLRDGRSMAFQLRAKPRVSFSRAIALDSVNPSAEDAAFALVLGEADNCTATTPLPGLLEPTRDRLLRWRSREPGLCDGRLPRGPERRCLRPAAQ